MVGAGPPTCHAASTPAECLCLKEGCATCSRCRVLQGKKGVGSGGKILRKLLAKVSLTDRSVQRSKAEWLRTLPSFEPSATIPKIIHQTFKSKQLPPALLENVDYIRSSNPDWEHNLYDDEDVTRLIERCYGEKVLSIFESLSTNYGAARADLFRYLAVYALGGVYLDIKSRFTKPISDVLSGDESYVLSYWDDEYRNTGTDFGVHPDLAHLPCGEFQQWHVISIAGHPFLRHVIATVLSNIEHYRPWLAGVGRNGVLRTTGPIAYTVAIQPIMNEHEHRLYQSSRLLSLEYSMGSDYDHLSVFKSHYSKQTNSIVDLEGLNRMTWSWVQKLRSSGS